MSRDTVDDLHDAEDAMGALLGALEAVARHASEHPWQGLDDAPELMVRVTNAIAAGKAYCRCEQDDEGNYECDEDCGCPAEHPLPHHEPEFDEDGRRSKARLFRDLHDIDPERFADVVEKGLKARHIGDETFGLSSFIYVQATPGGREALEATLIQRGHAVDPEYFPGSDTLAIGVQYFKGWHWDE